MYYGTCFLCGKLGTLEEHHVFPASLRNKSELYGLKVGLCGESCHRTGRRSAHGSRETANALKSHMQTKWMIENHASVHEFRLEFYKNYLDPEVYVDERKYPMNIAALSGRLVADPELRYTSTSKPVATFTIAVDRPGTKDKTDFISCVAWDKKAEFVSKYFKKGQRIEASGVLTTRSYEDSDNKKRKVTEVRCDQIFFGESKKQDEPQYTGTTGSFHELDASEDEELPF